MSERRVVYEGYTALGFRTIREGDTVEFSYGSAHTGVAFYSTRFTPQNISDHEITCRLPSYDYGSDPQNCHSWHCSKLVTHIIAGPREVRKSGFGKWVSKHV